MTLDASGTFWYSDTPFLQGTKWGCSAFPRMATWGRCGALCLFACVLGFAFFKGEARRAAGCVGRRRGGSRISCDTPHTPHGLTRAHASPSNNNQQQRQQSFTIKATGQKLCFVNTHLDHESEEARTKAAQLLLDKLPSISDGLPYVVVGAFVCLLLSFVCLCALHWSPGGASVRAQQSWPTPRRRLPTTPAPCACL